MTEKFVVHCFCDTNFGALDYYGYQILSGPENHAVDQATDNIISWAEASDYEAGDNDIVTQTLSEPYLEGSVVSGPSNGFEGCKVTRVPTLVTLMPE